MSYCYYFYNAALLADTVDLGLPSGTLWAKCNIGANTETDYGDYFMWGSTTPNTNTPCDWKHAPFNNGQSEYDEDYFNAHKSEWLTEEGILKSEYDAARQIMGGDWRMPTKEDIEELLEGTTNEWVRNYNNSGINGMLFTSKANCNTLFFPAAGSHNKSFSIGEDRYGFIWSSSLNILNHGRSWKLHVTSNYSNIPHIERRNTLSVRGVIKK